MLVPGIFRQFVQVQRAAGKMLRSVLQQHTREILRRGVWDQYILQAVTQWSVYPNKNAVGVERRQDVKKFLSLTEK